MSEIHGGPKHFLGFGLFHLHIDSFILKYLWLRSLLQTKVDSFLIQLQVGCSQ